MIDKNYQPSEVEGRIAQAWEQAGAFTAGRPERTMAWAAKEAQARRTMARVALPRAGAEFSGKS